MKKLLIAAAACIALTIYGCSKNAAPAPELTGITGTFKYIGYSGGLAGFKFTPVSAENYLQFDTGGNKILFYSGDTSQNCSTFTYAPFENSYNGLLTIKDNIFTGGNGFGNKYNVSFQHDTMSLYPADCMDCFEAHYKAVNRQFSWCTGAGAGH